MKLEVFFDYTCPFCMRGHEDLLALLPEFPGLELEWRPCEAHPRPERYGLHSDLLARGMYLVQELGGDVMEYHQRAYRAAKEQLNIEDPLVVATLVQGMVDQGTFHTALCGDGCLRELEENNRMAWAVHQFPAVPSLRAGERLLPSAENVGLTPQRMGDFLRDIGA